MPVEYVNRKSQKYYLHQGTTKTGKPKYFFSMKSQGKLVETIPDGFEIYENPNAQVFLQRVKPQIITNDEITTVEEGMKKFSSLQYYQIDLKKDIISVYVAEQDVNFLLDIFNSDSVTKVTDIQSVLSRSISYSAMLRFVQCR